MSELKQWGAAGKPTQEKTLEEWAAEACGNGKGIHCPKCNCSFWAVYYTRLGSGLIKRKRICRNPNCCHAIVTHEKQIGR